jgi:hypothetical protein
MAVSAQNLAIIRNEAFAETKILMCKLLLEAFELQISHFLFCHGVLVLRRSNRKNGQSVERAAFAIGKNLQMLLSRFIHVFVARRRIRTCNASDNSPASRHLASTRSSITAGSEDDPCEKWA